MRHEREVIETKKEVTYTCDICEIQTTRKCYFCRKDICPTCAEWFEPYDYSGNYGDYPTFCCKECWEKGKDLREMYFQKQEQLETYKDKLDEEWKRRCKIEN